MVKRCIIDDMVEINVFTPLIYLGISLMLMNSMSMSLLLKLDLRRSSKRAPYSCKSRFKFLYDFLCRILS